MCIVSHSKKFVFIHIPKTGGRAIEKYFYKFLSENDIVGKNFQHCQNFKIGTKIIGQHERFDKIQMFVPEANNYFSFIFIRNPWSWIVSSYTMLSNFSSTTKKENKFSNFRDYIENLYKYKKENYKDKILKIRLKNIDKIQFMVNMNNKIDIDFIGRFEFLQKDFDEIKSIIGLKDEEDLKNYNGRTKHFPYKEYYRTQDLIDKVGFLCQEDIEYWGFDFDSSATKNFGLIEKE